MHIGNKLLLSVALTLFTILSPASAWSAIQPSAGKVTQVSGTATLQRVGLAQALAVHFRDDVYLKDKIHTKEKSLVRVLLGGKALVTVRELSVLTITEAEDHAVINISSGTVGLSVARKRLKPGEYIEINTPHAIAAVRGTELLTKVGKDSTNFNNLPDGQQETDATGKPKGVDVTPKTGTQDQQTIVAGQKIAATDQGLGDRSNLTPQEIAQGKKTINPDEYGGINKDAPKNLVDKQTDQAKGLLDNIVGEGEGNNEGPLAEQQPQNTEGETNENPGNELTAPQAQQTVVNNTQAGISNGTTNNLVNGGFETGDFTGWTQVDQAEGSGSSFIYSAGQNAPLSGLPIPDPIEGNFAMTTDQTGPGSHVLYQDVTVPQTNPLLRFSVFIRNNLGNDVGDFFNPGHLDFTPALGPNQHARGDILRPGADPFSTDPADILFTFGITDGDDEPFDWETNTFDLSSLAGQDVRLRFAEVDNQTNFNVGLDNFSLFASVETSTSLVQLFQDGRLFTDPSRPHLRLVGETHSIATGPDEAIFDLNGRESHSKVDPETGFTIGTDRPIQGEVDGEPAPIQQSLLEVTADAEVTAGQYFKIDTALLEATAPLLNLIGSTVNALPPDASSAFMELSYQAKVTETMPIMAMDASVLNIQNGHFLSLGNQTILNVLSHFLVLNNGSQLNLNSSNGFLVQATGSSAFNVTGALINFGGTGNNVVQAQNSAFSETINGIPFSFTNGATSSQVSVIGTPIQNTDLGSVNLPNGGSLIQVDGPNATVNIQGQTIN